MLAEYLQYWTFSTAVGSLVYCVHTCSTLTDHHFEMERRGGGGGGGRGQGTGFLSELGFKPQNSESGAPSL